MRKQVSIFRRRQIAHSSQVPIHESVPAQALECSATLWARQQPAELHPSSLGGSVFPPGKRIDRQFCISCVRPDREALRQKGRAHGIKLVDPMRHVPNMLANPEPTRVQTPTSGLLAMCLFVGISLSEHPAQPVTPFICVRLSPNGRSRHIHTTSKNISAHKLSEQKTPAA